MSRGTRGILLTEWKHVCTNRHQSGQNQIHLGRVFRPIGVFLGYAVYRHLLAPTSVVRPNSDKFKVHVVVNLIRLIFGSVSIC